MLLQPCIYVFQSTLPQGERPVIGSALGGGDDISIHAPTRGATYVDGRFGAKGKFQSTLPQGERPKSTHLRGNIKIFQSTLPQGERRSVVVPIPVSKSFQSTLPQGERLKIMN